MARKPNYSFERMERERLKAQKLAERAAAKRERREAANSPESSDDSPAEDEED